MFLQVLEADPKKNKLILSQRQAVAEQRDQVVDNVLSTLEEDQIVSGNVVRITDFGAFVDINGIDVLIKKFTPKEHRIALSTKDIKA